MSGSTRAGDRRPRLFLVSSALRDEKSLSQDAACPAVRFVFSMPTSTAFWTRRRAGKQVLVDRRKIRHEPHHPGDLVGCSCALVRSGPNLCLSKANTVELAITPLSEGTSGSLSPRGRGLG